MSNPRIYPLTFTPALRDYLWGGRRLETLFGRKLPPGRVAESWEISGHPHAPTPADTGYWAGQPLPEILADLGERLTGSRSWWALKRDKFPLLVKLLDADLDLSVQVHPNDVFAQALTELKSIIIANRLTRQRQLHNLRPLLVSLLS